MMNILQLQDQLKGLSQEQLVREMQMPSGSAPQYLVLSEITRRKKMQDALTAEQQRGPQATVAQEAIAAAGVPQAGLGQMAQAMAPRTDAVQNTGIAQVLPPEMPVQGMAEGGYLSGLSDEEKQRVMLAADMRALGRRSYLAEQAEKQGVSPEALMGRYGLYETGLAPAPEDPAAAQRLYRDELIAAAGGMDPSGPYAYLFDQGDRGLDLTSVNPSYTEDRPDRFPEEAPRLPVTGYALPLPDEMTSYERRQNSELEQPRSWFRGQSPRLVAAAMPPAGDPVPPMSGLGMEPVLEFLPGLTDAEKQRVMLIADMRAFGRRGYNTAASARRAGTTPEALMGRRKVYNTGLYPEPSNPAEMADGGYVRKMAPGGEIIVRNGRQYEALPDGSFIDLATGQRTLFPSNTMVPQAAYDGSISLAAPSGAAAREYLDNQMARPGDYQAEANLALLADAGRTWGQRNIGDPLRNFFQPIGDAARDVGQPIGGYLEEVGQPIGDYLEEVGRPIGEGAPEFVLGPAPVEPPPVLARQAQFEPVGESDQEALTRAQMASIIPSFNEVTGIVDPERLREEGLLSPEQEALLYGRADRDQQGAAAIPTAEEVAAAEEARKINEELAASDEPTGPTGPAGPSGGTGAGGAAATGASSYEQELIDALARADKRATQDKWLALAQAGLAIMDAGARQGTFAGAVGEGGAKGLAAFRQGRDEAEAARLGLMKELEAARMAQMQLAMRGSGGGGGGGLTPYQMYQISRDEAKALDDQMKNLSAYAETLPPDSADAVAIKAMLSDYYLGGTGGNTVLPSAVPQ